MDHHGATGLLAFAAHARLDERPASELDTTPAPKLDIDPFTDAGRTAGSRDIDPRHRWQNSEGPGDTGSAEPEEARQRTHRRHPSV